MKNKKIPLRMCVVSKETLPKSQLVRVVRTTDGNVIVDISGKVNGKGAYIKCDKDIFAKARKTCALDRCLGVCVSEDIYVQLERLLDK